MNEAALISKLNDLYVLQRWKYLKLFKDGNSYDTRKFYKIDHEYNSGKRKFKRRPLTDYDIIQHLNGKCTLGVFAGKENGIESSKFLTFDIDVRDKTIARWYVYRIGNALLDIGISDFYVSYSGRKGYHLDLFFDKSIPVSILMKFHRYICTQADCLKNEYGEVEFRPTYTQGVKIPLGFNYMNKASPEDNYCCFVDYLDNLKPIEDSEYIYSIRKIDNIEIYFIVDEYVEDSPEGKQIIERERLDYQNIKKSYTPLDIYRHNIDEEYTIEKIQQLEKDGLKETGTRNNALFNICRLYKHYGLVQEDNHQLLIEWMQKQRPNTYSTKWDDVLKDISYIVQYVYKKDCSITKSKDISVSYQEIKQILQASTKNEKLLLFAMVVHSKRYASKNGVFYFPYTLIEKTTGLSDRTITKYINALYDNKFIDILSRNEDQIINGQWIRKKNNKYKILITHDSDLHTDNEFVIDKGVHDYEEAFDNCVLRYFDIREIKQYCGRRHSEHILGRLS